MKFIIYVDNVQHIARINARFTKKICNATYIGPNLVILHLSLKNILTKFMLFAIHKFSRINTTLMLLLGCTCRTHIS